MTSTRKMKFILSPLEYIGFVDNGKVTWYCCKYDGKIATVTKESASRSELGKPVWKNKKKEKKKEEEEQSLLKWVK